MKCRIYSEKQIEAIGEILGEIKVKGVKQARLLVVMENIIKKGIEVNAEEQEDGNSIHEESSDCSRTEKENDLRTGNNEQNSPDNAEHAISGSGQPD